MKTIKGPAIFLAQFAGTAPHLQNFNDMCKWAKECGFVGVQLPSWDGRVMDLAKAADSKSYCDELKGVAAKHGIEITELAAHLQGQLVAVHPAYDLQFDNFAPKEVHGNPGKRQAWAVEQMKLVAKASKNLGLKNCAAFPGALAWPYLYPWPQRPPGLIEAAFDELAKRWKPILDVFEDNGQNCCFEVHPGEDIFDGTTFEMFLERVKGHEACNILFDPSHFVLQQLDYLAYIDIYHERIKMYPREGRGVPSRRASKVSTRAMRSGWTAPAASVRSATARWISAASSPSSPPTTSTAGRCSNGNARSSIREDGAREGAPFIKKHIIRVTEKAFDDFAAGGDNSVALQDAGPASDAASFAGAWSAAARAPSSAPCIAWPRGSTAATSWSPACSRRTPRRRSARAAALGLAPDARLCRSSRRWSRREAARPTASRWCRSSRPTTCTTPQSAAFLEAGIDVICDKPLTTNLADA